MKKTRIGIPRAFLYYRDYILWKTFFEGLGCTLILSPITNREITYDGSYFSVDGVCLPFKIYLGHIKYLASKCDYILVPRVCNYGRRRRVCMRFNGIYDVIHNLFPEVEILDYDIDYLNFKFPFLEFIKMGLKVNKNLFKIIYYYIKGKYREKKHNLSLANGQVNVLKSNNMKVLIVGYPYVIYDEILGGDVIQYFKDNHIDILYADRMDRKEAEYYAMDFLPTLNSLYAKEIIGSIFYYKNIIAGIVFLSTFPCDFSLFASEEVIRHFQDMPVLNIVLENINDMELSTKLQSFKNLLIERRNK